ncbi:MAG TPA: hypothetical protein PKA54_01935 [Chitinophagaceae bacterium]|nr:MAG: hypothetical protein UZ11_BCD004001215 [Bacteroidetes bacterium OLB11]HMN32113.1 hypothetical protein [Chitinophagaceae bacterium]
MYKNTIQYILFSILISINAIAQNNADKITLLQGQKIKLTSIDTSMLTQMQGSNPMDMKTFSNSTTEIEILDIQKEQIIATQTLKHIAIDFDGYGQKMTYNSNDSNKKQDGMMAEQLKNKINHPDTIYLSFDGKLIDNNNSKDDKKRGGGGMMRMMNQGGANLENIFLLIPNDAKEGNGWKKDNSKDDIKTQTIYFIEKINNNIVEVSFKKKSKGIMTTKGGPGGELKIDIDNLSDGYIIVDKSTGLVKSYTEKTQSKSKFNAMGQDISSTGTIVSHQTIE